MTLPILHPQHKGAQEKTFFEPICSTTRSILLGWCERSFKGKPFILLNQVILSLQSCMIGQYVIEWLRMRPETVSVMLVADLIVVKEYDKVGSPRQLSATFFAPRLAPLKAKALADDERKHNDQVTNAVWLTLPRGPHRLARTMDVHLQTHDLVESDGWRTCSLPGSAVPTRNI